MCTFREEMLKFEDFLFLSSALYMSFLSFDDYSDLI